MLIRSVALALAAVVIGINFGWHWVLAPLLGYVLLRWSMASLRVLVTDGRGMGAPADPTPLAADERTLFWCEECGTEVQLLVQGTPRPPSHCGQRMHERAEILGDADER